MKVRLRGNDFNYEKVSFIFSNIMAYKRGTPMPNFNKGVFEYVQFEASPIGRFRILSSIYRIYTPYSPGTHFDFKIKLKSISGKESGVRIFLQEENEKETDIEFPLCGIKSTEIIVKGPSLPGKGLFEYYIGDAFGNGKPEVIASVTAFHNDQVVLMIAGAMIGTILTFGSAIILAMLDIDKFWRIFNPFLGN